jgi:LacI family transcriptional regulator
VVNGKANVRPETRARVEQALADLGYVPNAAARSLITRQTRLLGLVVSNITNGFYPEIIEAITSRAMEAGYTVILGSAGERVSSQAAYMRVIAEHRAEGVILTSTLLGDVQDLEEMARSGLAIVLANRVRDDIAIDSVALDNVTAGRKATDHLLGHGRRRVAYVGGRADAPTGRDRFAGYRQALTSAGIAVDERIVAHGEFTRECGYSLTRAVVTSGPPDAIIAADDTVALGALDALADVGLSVPGDVALVGFDDIPAASLRVVWLTTISSSARNMGQIALSLLLDRTTGRYRGQPRRVVLPPELIVRGSCGSH